MKNVTFSGKIKTILVKVFGKPLMCVRKPPPFLVKDAENL